MGGRRVETSLCFSYLALTLDSAPLDTQQYDTPYEDISRYESMFHDGRNDSRDNVICVKLD